MSNLSRIFALLSFLCLSLLVPAGAATIGVQVETVHISQGASSYLRLLCSSDIAISSIRIPLKIEETGDITIDSVSFANTVAKPASWFKYQSQITNANRRGFISVLPNVSVGAQSFPPPGGEIARIYVHASSTAALRFVMVDSFKVGFDQIDAADEFGYSYQPSFTFGGIWIDQKSPVQGDDGIELPGQFALMQNSPNPFNPTTRIEFDLPKSSPVRLDVYDLLGQHVATLIDARYPSGHHAVDWNAGSLPSGIYLYRIETSEGDLTRKMLLLK